MRRVNLPPRRVMAALFAAIALAISTSSAATAAAPEPTLDLTGLEPHPDNLADELEAGLLACPNPADANDGADEYNIVDEQSVSRILLREGDRDENWGRDHIAERYASGYTNHELTNYAKDRWNAAWNLGAWDERSTCYYAMSYPYQTPGGAKRTMCVFFDFKNITAFYGSKGVVTAYWKSGFIGTVNC